MIASSLTAAAFAPFGAVTAAPLPGQREHLGPLRNLRSGVPANFAWTAPATGSLPMRVAVMERHRLSSQTFVPLSDVRWLVLVAPSTAKGGPDMARAVAFLADGTQAITFAPGTWHHPLTALTEGARFAVLTFLDGGSDDQEFIDVADGVLVTI